MGCSCSSTKPDQIVKTDAVFATPAPDPVIIKKEPSPKPEPEPEPKGPVFLMYIEGETLIRTCDSAQQLFKDFTHANNVSGKLQRKDFVEYFHKQGNTSSRAIKHVYAKFDKKSSGSITFMMFFDNIFLVSKTVEEQKGFLEQKENEIVGSGDTEKTGSAVVSSPRKSRRSEKITKKLPAQIDSASAEPDAAAKPLEEAKASSPRRSAAVSSPRKSSKGASPRKSAGASTSRNKGNTSPRNKGTTSPQRSTTASPRQSRGSKKDGKVSPKSPSKRKKGVSPRHSRIAAKSSNSGAFTFENDAKATENEAKVSEVTVNAPAQDTTKADGDSQVQATTEEDGDSAVQPPDGAVTSTQ